MTLSLKRVNAFTFDITALSQLTWAIPQTEMLPADIGMEHHGAGFTLWSVEMPLPIILINEVILLSYAFANKSVDKKRQEIELLKRIANGEINSQELRSEIHSDLLVATPQVTRSSSILLDTSSGIVLISGTSNENIDATREHLMKVFPKLNLQIPSAGSHGCAHRLRKCLLGIAPIPPCLTFGKIIDIETLIHSEFSSFKGKQIPNDDIVRLLETSVILAVELCWNDELHFVIEHPLTIRAMKPIKGFRVQLDTIKKEKPGFDRLTQEVHAWISVLRPLIDFCLEEFKGSQFIAKQVVFDYSDYFPGIFATGARNDYE